MLDGRGTADSHQAAYRPDLDGLRAVAVLSVIAFHLSPKLLRGGYLGVDIFFVLSGYLITNIIWREALNGRFSIARFYERRVRRIMPALLVTLIAVSACAIALLLPIDLKGYAKSVFASLAFVANVYFWRDTDYFSQQAQEKPLLHVWSLGIEEQFYIVFPLLVILCIKWRRSALLPLASALVLLSLLANIFCLRHGAEWPAFYLLPMRAWELGTGALLALAPSAKAAGPLLRHTLALLAAVLLLTGLAFNGVLSPASVPAALSVVIGTALAINLGSIGGSWLTQVLSATALVWVGLISYSLYLWHWPILVFAWYYLVRDSLSPVESLIAVSLMFALAGLSWRFVERPFRDRSMKIGRVLVWVGCGSAAVALTAGAVLAWNGFPLRFSADVARVNSAVGAEYRCGLTAYISFGAMHACAMSLPSHNPEDATVALFGNSHAQMYAPLVSEILQANHERGILVPLNSCKPMPDLNGSKRCMALAAMDLHAIEATQGIRIVILSMSWDPPTLTPTGAVPKGHETEFLIASLDRLIDDLKQHGKTVVLVGPLATPETEEPSIVARQMAFHHRVDEPVSVPEQTFMAKQGEILAHYSARGDILFIRPDRVQCELGTCDYIRDGASIFADYSHVAEAALPLFRPVFEPALRQAFLSANLPGH
jgi:peptidoglycan/LPS O-acetylase OafA/YrhL